MRPPAPALLLCALLWGCAHAAPPRAPGPSWPEAPGAPQVRWLASFPDPDRPTDRPLWGRLADAVLGIDRAAEGRALLLRPFGLAALPGGFAVADPDARRVLRVDWAANRWEEVACPGRAWQMPMAVAAGPSGELYVADAAAGVVLRVAAGACAEWGRGLLERPTGLALSGGRLYVVDPPRHQVLVLGPDGQEQLRFGSRGDSGGQLNFPTSIAALADGSLQVVDALNFRVARYSPEGRFLGAYGSAGDGEGAFGRPKAVASDPGGRSYISDAQHDVVIVYSAASQFQFAIGGHGDGPGRLTMPAGLAVGGGYLYVADALNHRVQIFRLEPGGPS